VASLWRALTASGEEGARAWLERSHPATLGASAERALEGLGVSPAYRTERPVAEELVSTLIAALAG
jgi:uroporphyrinogen-III synthase